MLQLSNPCPPFFPSMIDRFEHFPHCHLQFCQFPGALALTEAQKELPTLAKTLSTGSAKPVSLRLGDQQIIYWNLMKQISIFPSLVGGLEQFLWLSYSFPYIGNNHPNWLIFFRGLFNIAMEATAHLQMIFPTRNLKIYWIFHSYVK